MDPNNNFNPQGTDPNAFGGQPYGQPIQDPNAFVQPAQDPNAFVQPAQDPNAFAQPGMNPNGFAPQGNFAPQGDYAQPGGFPQPGMNPNTFGQPGAAPYGQPTPAYGADAPKKKTGLIIAICLIAAAIITVIVLLLTGVIGGGGGKDGTYTCEYSMFGETINMTIKIDGKKGNFKMEYNGEYATDDSNFDQDFDVKWEGDVLSMDVDGDALTATYNSKDKTLTVKGEDFLGEDLVFKKK